MWTFVKPLYVHTKRTPFSHFHFPTTKQLVFKMHSLRNLSRTTNQMHWKWKLYTNKATNEIEIEMKKKKIIKLVNKARKHRITLSPFDTPPPPPFESGIRANLLLKRCWMSNSVLFSISYFAFKIENCTFISCVLKICIIWIWTWHFVHKFAIKSRF